LLDKELEGLKDSSLSNSEMRSHPIINHSEAPQLRSRLQSSGNNNNNNMLSDHHHHLLQAAAGASSILESSLNVSSLH
jgi:predicted esterase